MRDESRQSKQCVDDASSARDQELPDVVSTGKPIRPQPELPPLTPWLFKGTDDSKLTLRIKVGALLLVLTPTPHNHSTQSSTAGAHTHSAQSLCSHSLILVTLTLLTPLKR